MSETHFVQDIMKVVIDGDTVFVTSYKEWTYEAAVEYLKILDGVRARNKTLFILADGTHASSIPEQRVRRLIALWSAENTFNGLAMFGVAPLLRGFVMLIFNAANLFRRGSAPVAVVKDEAAAWHWIAERRAALNAKTP